MDHAKAKELDVVELIEDLPKYGLSKGSRGTVVEAFREPEEAYMIEFQQDSNRDAVIADWVLPVQIRNLEDQAQPLFGTGLNQRVG